MGASKSFVVTVLLSVCFASAADCSPQSRWRGFNLCEMFGWRKGCRPPRFVEADFIAIRDWGFNFARLPMDYRFWIKGEDWNAIDPKAFVPIDEAVRWGEKYGVHVQLCFHRAPGYRVNDWQGTEKRNLFADEGAVDVCARHWRFFAKRYRDIPSSRLSFNLVNEPPDMSDATYVHVVKRLVSAIRQEDTNRFVVADGLNFATRPVHGLTGIPSLGQALRGYAPIGLSHYGARWVGSGTSAAPEWPPEILTIPEGFLAGPCKPGLRNSLELYDLPSCEMNLAVGGVSGRCLLVVRSDGKKLRDFVLNPAEGGVAWSNVVYRSTWKVHQGVHLGELSVRIPEDVRRLSISLDEGDWVYLDAVRLSDTIKHQANLPIKPAFQKFVNARQRFVGWRKENAFVSRDAVTPRYLDVGKEFLYRRVLEPWDALAAHGSFTMVGEFGVYNVAPHGLCLAWMEDNLQLWKERNLGWALWNLRGPFGVLDSDRKDVEYEDFRGHKLDRKMLNLLQKY